MLKIFQPACSITLLFFSFTLYAEEIIDHHQFPLYQAPINVQTQHEFDYINNALWTALRYYQEQQADSYTARLKLSCQQSGMAYRYQDFIAANPKFSSAEDQDFLVTKNLIEFNTNLHHNQCSQYLSPQVELNETQQEATAKVD